MTGRAKTSGKTTKARPRKAAKPKRRAASAAAFRSPSSDADLQEQLKLRTELADARRLLAEALEQQTATSSVLKIISQSAFDLKSVLQSLVVSATRLCQADKGAVTRRIGEEFFFAEVYGFSPEFVEYVRPIPVRPERGTVAGKTLLEGRTVHVADVPVPRDPIWAKAQRLGSFRTMLGVPMLHEGAPIGVLALSRSKVKPFTDKQIELVKNFAAQAVIAIENTRLLNELRQRTAELSESLEQQTATSEVLSVISSKPGELEPVFTAMLDNATRICEAKYGVLHLYDASGFHPVAKLGAPPALAEYHRQNPSIQPRPGSNLDLLVRSKAVVHIADDAVSPSPGAPARLANARSTLTVPMLKDSDLIGAFSIYRQEVRPFTVKQIALVQNFAAQAVIAIENTRLLNELRESLQQQTATSEVLSVISRSPGELEPVFQAMLENAIRICGAGFGNLLLYDGEKFRVESVIHRDRPEWAELRRRESVIRATAVDPLGRVVSTKQLQHIADLRMEQAYVDGFPPLVALVDMAGARTILLVPMLKEGQLIGIIAIYRLEVLPFTDKQIALVQNFAAQAVIAIENTRLLNELRQRTDDLSEALEQQTATSEVLNVISNSVSDAQPVFNAIVQSALTLFPDAAILIALRDGETVRAGAFAEADAERAKRLLSRWPIPLTRQYNHAIAILDRRIIDIPDAREAPPELSAGSQYFLTTGYRAITITPMMRGGEAIGALSVVRSTPGPLSDKQIALLKTFADQAVIAIENARLLNELRQRTDDLTESLEQQTAASEVLKVISSSPGELETVFSAILENATRICSAKFGILFLSEGDRFRTVAMHNAPAALVEARRRDPLFRPAPHTTLGRMLHTRQTAQVEDMLAEQSYFDVPPGYSRPQIASLAGARTNLSVPMVQDNELIGALVIYRQEVRSFTDKQIELVQNFAAQAVIAIENARLLNELRESLQQQTATAEVLQVISSSPGELAPVFNAILEKAMHLCEASFGGLFLLEGERYFPAALHGVPERYAAFLADNTVKPGPGTAPDRLWRGERFVHNIDLAAEEPYLRGDPQRCALVDFGGARSAIQVALRKDDAVLGIMTIYRQEMRPFTDKQIELVQNFAAQAVIAIENTRLLNELRESLAQQTATTDVLQVISRSAFDLQPVFDTVAENSVRLCGADKAFIFRFDDKMLHMVAGYNASTELAEFVRQNPLRPGRHGGTARAALERRTVHIADVLVDPEYTYGAKNIDPIRTVLGVPILKGDELLGVIMIYRLEVSPFTEKQIALVETFADQAAIAIENVRLFEDVEARTEELSESLQQQTATSEVLKVISRSTFDLQTVLQTLVEAAARLCEADQGTIAREQNAVFVRAASCGFSEQFNELVKNLPVEQEAGSATGRALLVGRTVHIPDVQADPDYTFADAKRLGGFRTILAVPMLREGNAIGVIALTRIEVRPFTDKQIELVTTFADQAAIAIENVRLFESVEARTRELARSLEDLQTAQDRLVQTQKLASLGQLTAGIAHEIKNPLNFVNNFSSLSTELLDELRQALLNLPIDKKAQADIDDLTETLRANLGKIEQHGKRADSIVKNMLLHSREGSGEHRPIDINAVVEESLNLAYHGARAEKQDFNITLERAFDPAAGEVDVFPQEITRVLLNLIANGFYAATKRKAHAGNDAYEPALTASTRSLGDRVEIRIRDNGIGIPPEVKEKMFNPFFTTKPPGEGTGLGLSLSYDIVVKQHAGSIEVETEPGTFTEFKIILPRAAATIAKSGGRA